MVLHQSFLEAMSYTKQQRMAIASNIRKFDDKVFEDIRLATTICQYTFLNGYHYAEKGINGLDNEFKEWAKKKYTKTLGHGKSYETNEFEEFLNSNNAAAQLFKKGMEFYKSQNK